MFSPSHTLLLITSRVLARVDFSGRRRLQIQNVWIEPCAEMAAPTVAAAMALNLGPRRAGRVWILSTDFWTGVIGLAADVSPLLSNTELNQALALEAEIESGISAFASRVGAVRVPEPSSGDSRWCITHISTAELQYLSDALNRSHTQLVGAAHPAAAEIVKAAAEGSVDANKWIADWEEQLVPAMDAGSEEIRSAVSRWAERWAEYLVQTPLLPLVIRCDQKPISARQRMMTSVAMALLTAAPCGFWHWQTQQRIVAANRTIANLEQRQTTQEATQRSLQALEIRLAKLRKETSQAETQRRELETALFCADRTHAQHNHRWLALLDAIAGSIDDQCWIQQLESKPVQATVHGLALDNAAAHRFASGLEVGLQGSGWTVLPAETKPAGNQLVSFKIVLDASRGPAKAHESGVAKLSPRASANQCTALTCLGTSSARDRERLMLQ